MAETLGFLKEHTDTKNSTVLSNIDAELFLYSKVLGAITD